jgi:hypothetical protein
MQGKSEKTLTLMEEQPALDVKTLAEFKKIMDNGLAEQRAYLDIMLRSNLKSFIHKKAHKL